jgi:hypothetical protein
MNELRGNQGMTTKFMIRSIGALLILLGAMPFALKFFGGPLIQIPGDVLSIISIIGGIRLLRFEESGRQLISLLSLAYIAMAGLQLIIGIFFPKARVGEIAGQHFESQALFWGVALAAFAIFGLIYAFLRRTDVKATFK